MSQTRPLRIRTFEVPVLRPSAGFWVRAFSFFSNAVLIFSIVVVPVAYAAGTTAG